MSEQTKRMLLAQLLVTIDLEQIYLVPRLKKISWGGNIFLLHKIEFLLIQTELQLIRV